MRNRSDDQTRKRNTAGGHTIRAAVSIALAIFANPALAELSWSVDAGVGHTDNATLVDSNPESDTISSFGGEIDYQLKGVRTDASLNAQGNYEHYIDGTFDDDLQGSARGNVVFGVVPDTFFWTVEDTFGQIATNQFEPVTPDNRQNINDFRTGPDFVVRLGAQSDLEFQARYGDVRYEDSDEIDEQTWDGSISFRRHLSPSTHWAIVASNNRIEYDAPGTEKYDQPRIYGTWQSTGARQSLSVDVGANQVRRRDDSFTKPLVRIDWNRKVAPSWTFNLNLGSEYQNSSERFVRQNSRSDSATSDVALTDVPAQTYSGVASLAFRRTRTQFSVGGGYFREKYVVENRLDEDRWYVVTEFARRLNPRLQGFVSYRIEKNTYDSSATLDETTQTVGTRLEWGIGPSVFLTLGYEYEDSDSDSQVNRYSSNLAYLLVSYRRGPGMRSASFHH